MEIERKFLVREMPKLTAYPVKKLEQGYLSTGPVVRVRREDNEYYLTYKGGGLVAREEYNLPLSREAYEHLREKCDGNLITKKRYLIPLGELTAELDVFEGAMEGLIMAEVEFSTLEEAYAFTPPDWMGKDVTEDVRYHNSYMINYTYKELF